MVAKTGTRVYALRPTSASKTQQRLRCFIIIELPAGLVMPPGGMVNRRNSLAVCKAVIGLLPTHMCTLVTCTLGNCAALNMAENKDI